MSRHFTLARTSSLAAIALLSLASMAFADNQPDATASTAAGTMSSLGTALQNPKQLPAAAINTASSAAQNTLIPAIWPTAPDWLKRTEWNVQANTINDMQYSVLTTQPLYQSTERRDTLFVQGSYEHYKLYDIDRNTVNGGLGYRHLFFGDRLLLGANNFYDYEISHNHARTSFGADIKWNVVDGYANYYHRLTGAHSVDGATERVNNGYDFGIGAPLPYLPWAKAFARYYDWQGIQTGDSRGGEFMGELALHPNFTLVGGLRGNEPDTNHHDKYIALQFHLGADGKPTLLTDPISDKPFEARNLADETLSKVRRENRIMIERTTTTTGGITVVIKKG